MFPTGGERHDALPWIIKSYEQGAFRYEQEKEICDRFTWELAQVETLSSYIGNCLDIETSLDFYPLNKARAAAQDKAKQHFLQRGDVDHVFSQQLLQLSVLILKRFQPP